MMASSTSSSVHRPPKAQQLVRQNSSFLGTIKNIVTAPLGWFGHQDGDAAGAKRRRQVDPEPTEPILPTASEPAGSRVNDDDMGDTSRRSKRMRLNSPPRAAEGYNDPPAAAFARHPTNSRRRTSVVPRASSAVLPSSRGSRATLSPSRRHHTPSQIQRTMSIDPPQAISRRQSSSSFNFGLDGDNYMDTGRDVSTPPSPRPSFRIRSSMTPQPQQHVPARHISEPPPLNALISNPQFLHPPSQHHDRAPTPTLGSLVDARATRSPTRQNHSSLLFSTPIPENDAPAEKALQQLDVYKTPLLPTRMRSKNTDTITGNAIPDMFKSRRSSRLVLMTDDGERSRKKHKNSVNGTKPYAGEGGMKKLLARAKLEAEKDEDSSTSTPEKKDPTPPPDVPPFPPPPPPGSDWFTTAVSGAPGSTAGSSLRVGRQKTSRNHIQRPSRSRFSAADEDDGDDAMEEDESTKERKMLEEAAKKVPVFQIPAGFSFAKEAPAPTPSTDELNKAKEPPISSLPFSFSKPSSSSPASSAVPTFPTTIPTPIIQPKPAPFDLSSLPPPKKTDSGVPNFFANSQKVKETPLPTPAVLSFTPPTSSSTPSFFGTPPTTAPTKDGSSDKDSEPKRFSSLFGPPAPAASKPSEPAAAQPSAFSFCKPAGPSSPFPPVKAADDKPAITLTAATPSPFSFTKQEQRTAAPPTPTPFSLSKSPEVKPAASDNAPPSLPLTFNKPAAVETSTGPGMVFSFGAPEQKKEETQPAAPKPLFGVSAPSSLFGDAGKPVATFGDSKSTSPLAPAVAPPQSTPSPLGFNFGPPAAAVPSPAPVETPKPAFSFGANAAASSPAAESPKLLFGGGAFNFGHSTAAGVAEKKDTTSTTPFSFPATTPSTPSAESKPFAFGQSPSPAPPAVQAPAPIGFSFSGGGSANADVSSKPPFLFGAQTAAAQPARPITPPKGADVEFRMEESPSQDLQMNGNKDEASFSFGNGPSLNGNSSLFGGASSSTPASTSSPFSFNNSSASNPFGAQKAEESKPFGFGTAPQAPPINTSFSFGQTKDEQRPASAGAFSFGQTPASTPTAGPGFPFGGGAPASNPFGQPSAGSAPSSPATFNQPFSFGSGASAPTTNPFGFGSQPASPAGGNVALPPPAISTSFSNGGGFGQAPSPSSPFTAPQQIAQSNSGGAVFTIGAAPAAAPSGTRVIKKMPRRGAVKR